MFSRLSHQFLVRLRELDAAEGAIVVKGVRSYFFENFRGVQLYYDDICPVGVGQQAVIAADGEPGLIASV